MPRSKANTESTSGSVSGKVNNKSGSIPGANKPDSIPEDAFQNPVVDLTKLGTTPPPGVDPVVYNLLLQINTTTQQTDSKIESLTKKYETLDKRHADLEERCSTNEDNISQLQSDVQDVTYKLQVLHGRLTRSEVERKRLSKELEGLKAKSMNKNLIINVKDKDKYKETKGENTMSVAKSFLKNELKIKDSINITVAHRFGVKKEGKHRPIIITVPYVSDINKIMSQVKHLKDTGCYIDRQIPQSYNERKQMCLPEFKQAKSNGLKPMLIEDKLFVNGELQRQHLPPTLPDQLIVPETVPQIHEGETVEDSGSVFKGYAAEINDMDDIRTVIDTLLLKSEVSTTSHVMYAYRYADDGGEMCENFESDGDWGIGFHMLKFMRDNSISNHVLIVTRMCGPNFKHIGTDRMIHAINVCKSALELS